MLNKTLSLLIQLVAHIACVLYFWDSAWYLTFSSFLLPAILNAIMLIVFLTTRKKQPSQ